MRNATNKNADFYCLHCGAYVSAASALAGVRHRNHCPYCLWSRHLDLSEAGDRLSACKASMQPVGLTIKAKRDKYALRASGELMLIHCCTGCARLSINRIAADDIPAVLLEVFAASQQAPTGLKMKMRASGIRMLDRKQAASVRKQVLGRLETALD